MKIKGLLISMLACTAMLVGCSDDDIVQNDNALENQKVEKADAYLTFSIASATNSSRGSAGTNGVPEGTTNGDNHGNAEHSGHENAGTAAENQVNDIMVVFYGAADGFSDVFTINTGSTESSSVSYGDNNSYSTKLIKTTNNDNEIYYELSKPFAVNALGDYKLLVVINPAEKIKSLKARDRATALEIYNKITTTSNKDWQCYATSVNEIIGANKNNFMMANRKEVTINVKPENNDPENPANKNGEAIEVERVVSKITFRQKAADTGFQAIGSIKTGENLYTISETKYNYNIDKDNFWYKNSDGIYDYLRNLYKAEDPNGNEYWVYITKTVEGNETKIETKRYEIDEDVEDNYEGELADGKTYAAPVVKDATYTGTLVYVGTKTPTDETASYYVQLKKYALVNLNNKVYYVRHTSNNPATATSNDVWGFVNSGKYLIEPNTATKSATFTWDSPLEWPTGWANASTLFNNDFITVTDDIKAKNGGTTASNYLNAFTTTSYSDGENSVISNVTPSDTDTNGYTPEDNTIGDFLGYCLENTMLADNQNALTSTSIIFEAQIYDATGAVVDHMLEFNGSFYPSFLALAEAMGEGEPENSEAWAYTDEDYAKLDEDGKKQWAEDLYEYGITLYHGGKCYYFSSQIEHFDNDEYDSNGVLTKDGGKGVMENAIMRNNIYSLSVENVNGFGFSSIDLQSGVLNGPDSGTEQEKVYLTMKAKILPWIVRFNNIQF